MIKLEKSTYLGNVKRSFNIEGVLVNETIYNKKVSEEWHCHSNNHLTLILEGGNAEQRKREDIQAIPGKVLAYPTEILHRNRATLFPSRNINLEFDDTFLKRYDVTFNLPVNEDISHSILRIFSECIINDEISTASVHATLLNILKSAGWEDSAQNPRWITSIKELLNDRWDEILSLEELSTILGIHPVTVSKYFPKYFNCTLGEYSRKIKINKAFSLIRSSNLPFTEIALQCGFFDQSHFTKTFKRLTGLTPRDSKNL